MTREELVGIWRCRQTGGITQLHTDGSGVSRFTRSDGKTLESQLEWSHVDSAHWHLGVYIDPVPHIPGLENGAVQGIDYEIMAEDALTMSLIEFDVDITWVWERADWPNP